VRKIKIACTVLDVYNGFMVNTKKAQIEALAASVRALQTGGEYYVVEYNRPSGAWAYMCFRSVRAAARFIVNPPANAKGANRIDICEDGRTVVKGGVN
jgi:hypothetical protein